MDKTFLLSVFNFSIFTGVLFYYLRKPIAGFVSVRHETLKKEVSQVRDHLRTAQEKYEEFSAKLKVVDVEILSIKENYQKEATTLQGRLLVSAKQMASSLLGESRERSETLVQEYRDRLRSEVGTRVINRAQELIRERLTGDDRARIHREFSERVSSNS